MAATRYRRFLKLCEEWPRDETKKGRDLGTFLRQKVAGVFREGENTQNVCKNHLSKQRLYLCGVQDETIHWTAQNISYISDPEKCDQMYESLARINSNVYKEKFPRAKDTSFTGVTVEECRMLLGTGNMQQTDEEKKGVWKTLMQRFSSKPEDATVEKPEK